jgi:5-hydroxyisourate hydrolase
MGRLTTHILDTANGQPAAGVAVRLFSLHGERSLLKTLHSNEDGRTAAPLLEGDDMQAGTYELEFDIGDYFAAKGSTVSEPPFLNTVVIRFSVNSDEHYHVPLLASPWSYSTYRGS